MKTCSKCGEEKPLADFNARRGKTQAYCRVCQRGYHAEHYASNKADYLAKNGRRLALINARVQAMKARPCLDCGGSFPYYVMDFDHCAGDKVAGVSVMVHEGWSWEKIQAEIAKCDLVCANCHRIRTFKRLSCSSRRPRISAFQAEDASSNLAQDA